MINGDVNVMNNVQLEQLSGVSFVSGSVIIAPNLGPTPQLACLEEAGAVGLNPGNDYSAMDKLRVVKEFSLSDTPDLSTTKFPSLLSLESVKNITLGNIDVVLDIPKVHKIEWLALYGSSSPIFPKDLAVGQFSISGEQKDFGALDGLEVRNLDVQTFLGTDLPQISVTNWLTINNAPNLDFMSIDIGDSFPLIPPVDEVEAMMAGISVSQTGLTNLEWLTSVSTFTAVPRFTNNGALTDISALTGKTVELSYIIPDVYPSGVISGSPKLCKSSAQQVVDTMQMPTFFELSQINNGC